MRVNGNLNEIVRQRLFQLLHRRLLLCDALSGGARSDFIRGSSVAFVSVCIFLGVTLRGALLWMGGGVAPTVPNGLSALLVFLRSMDVLC